MKTFFTLAIIFISLLAVANKKPLDVLVTYNPRNVIYSGQEVECKIQLINTQSENKYEIIYFDKTEIIKRITNDTLTIHFKAGFSGVNYNDSGQVKILWLFKIREFSDSNDTIIKFPQKYFVNKPLAIFQSESPLIAYHQKINTVNVSYPYYFESYFKPRGTTLKINNAEVIYSDESEITFVPDDTAKSSTISVFCNGNHVESRTIKYLPFIEPEIIISNPYDKPKIELQINHPEYSNIKKLIPVKGWIKVIRNGYIVYNDNQLKKIKYQLKEMDTLLIQIEEIETIYLKVTRNINVNISKIITL